MRHALLVSEFLSTPWALRPERMAAFAHVLARWSANLGPTPEGAATVAADKAAVEARRAAASQGAGGGVIMVLPLYGVIAQRASQVEDVSGPGGTSTQRFTSALRQALADDAVAGILIDIDSPGGSVYGVGELADELYRARGGKPITAIANSVAASAAYWIGAAAEEFYVTPGGEVGSIGVWAAHEDWSKAMDDAGIKTTLVSAGEFKVEGNPYEPLTDAAKAFMQTRVNDYYGTFTKSVARARGVPVAQVRDGMGQGRVLGADQAFAEKMVDGVATFDEAVKALSKRIKQPAAAKGASRLAAANRALSIL
jgi:signal peptide peptidase SppA